MAVRGVEVRVVIAERLNAPIIGRATVEVGQHIRRRRGVQTIVGIGGVGFIRPNESISARVLNLAPLYGNRRFCLAGYARVGRSREFHRHRDGARFRIVGVGVAAPVAKRLNLPFDGRAADEAANRIRGRRSAELIVFVFGSALVLPGDLVSARVLNRVPLDGDRRLRLAGFARIARRDEFDLLEFVSAEVDRSAGDARVPRKVGGRRRILIVPFVDRLRSDRKRIVSRRRVRKERLRGAVSKVARAGPSRIARQSMICANVGVTAAIEVDARARAAVARDDRVIRVEAGGVSV